MKRVLLVVLSALALSFSVSAPASAHIFDNTAYTTCHQARTHQWTASSYVTDAHPTQMGNGWVEYHCCLDLYGTSHRWMFARRIDGVGVHSHTWSPVYGGWCHR